MIQLGHDFAHATTQGYCDIGNIVNVLDGKIWNKSNRDFLQSLPSDL